MNKILTYLAKTAPKEAELATTLCGSCQHACWSVRMTRGVVPTASFIAFCEFMAREVHEWKFETPKLAPFTRDRKCEDWSTVEVCEGFELREGYEPDSEV